MFTINDFWKLLQVVQGNDVDEITEAVISIARSERTTADRLFSTIIDQSAFSSPDYFGLRNFIRDIYATHRTLTTYQASISDVYKMPNDQLDELFRSFGYPYSTTLRFPTGNESPLIKVNFFLDLVNLYKRKGTPQSLLDVLKYYGLNKLDIYELSLLYDDRIYGNPNDLKFKTNKIAGTSVDDSILYFDFDFITDRDPHWLQSKSQVEYLHTINKINFPSQTPYFAIKPVYDEKTIDAETGIISRKVQDQYSEWVIAGSKPEDTDPTLPQDAQLSITGDVCSFLTNYLACVYTFNKIWSVGAPAQRYVCYDGTNISVQSILDEFDSIANVRIDTHEQWKELYAKYLDVFTRPIADNFLQDHLDAGNVLAILNPTVKSNLDTLAVSLEEVLGTLLNDLGEWIRSYMSFGFTNISYILFGIDSMFNNLRKVIEFFKPYRARIVPLEYLQLTSRLFNSVVVEDKPIEFDVEQDFHDFLTGDSIPCCNGDIECFSSQLIDLIKVSAPIPPDTSSIIVYLPDEITGDYSVVATMSSRYDIYVDAASFGLLITDKTPNSFTVLFSSPTQNERYWLDFLVRPVEPDKAGLSQVFADDFVEVTFVDPKPNSDYPVVVSLQNSSEIIPSKYAYTIIEKTTTSFKVQFTELVDSPSFILNWIIPDSGITGNTNLTSEEQVIPLPEEERNTYYAVAASIVNTVDATSSQHLFTIVEKTINDFKVKINAPPDSPNYYLTWNLFRYRAGEDEVCIADTTSCLETQTYSREYYDCGSWHDIGAVTDIPRDIFIEFQDNIHDALRCPVSDTTGFVVNETNYRVYKSNVEPIPIFASSVYYNLNEDAEPDDFYSLVACVSNVAYPTSPMMAYTIRGKTAFGFHLDLSHETENPEYKIDWMKSRDPNNSGLKGLNAGDTFTIVNYAGPKDTTSPIVVSLETTDSTSQQFLFEITDRTINGFTVRFSSPIPTNNYILNWIIPSSVNSGVELLPNGLDETTIVFSNPTLNEVNAVVATIINVADSTASMYPFQVIEKTITSFKIKFSSPIDSNNYYLAWEVVGAENKLDEFLFIQTGGFRHFDEEGVFDCSHGFDLISITIEDVTDYLLLETGFYLLQESGDRILL